MSELVASCLHLVVAFLHLPLQLALNATHDVVASQSACQLPTAADSQPRRCPQLSPKLRQLRDSGWSGERQRRLPSVQCGSALVLCSKYC